MPFSGGFASYPPRLFRCALLVIVYPRPIQSHSGSYPVTQMNLIQGIFFLSKLCKVKKNEKGLKTVGGCVGTYEGPFQKFKINALTAKNVFLPYFWQDY